MNDRSLPGVTSEERIVLHVDMDCFYASCERRRESALEEKPVVVGMGYEAGETHGAVATASYEAREHGVESAQAISQALTRLPRAVDADEQEEAVGHYRPVDMAYYESVSEEVKAVLHEVADTVREVSIDEAYVDVSDRLGWEGAPVFARNLKARIHETAGVPASIGVAPNMSTAKIASDHDKPDGLVVVTPDEIRSFLAPLDTKRLHGVGPVTARELRSMGIETVGELAQTDRSRLVDRFGARGGEIYDYARGHDDRDVEPVGDPKSLSNESAFTEPTEDSDRVRDRLRRLVEQVTTRTARRNALYKTIGIKVVTPPFDVHTRSHTLSGPVNDPALVERIVLDLIEEFDGRSVRKLGVRVSNLSFVETDQASLNDWERPTTESNGTDGAPVKPDGGSATENECTRQTSVFEFT
ncbi:DNA polymerase IV [Halocatena pleomorpha]|uniref:DNA polymerase IV n=1 Tax=Halocatena pleomorpha TaxID=1785090 RepID=A0A3P3R474_9EURY|nr:DNA polymerase IV [Halocatena pleomorpha]RRJ28272.1 DNA polymerase IV [Halocatena pleomorpha]